MYNIIDVAGPSRRLSQSALPDAPVVPEPERPHGRRLTTRLATALRALARHELRLANRIDPAYRPGLPLA
ncbi:hypothetical protein ACQBAU_12580 [Propionibacteriaceae bacterium Y2011]|uniref:hypothetical protein n=1 Tax=Microlunatus sp. Y2014 TaxID=3418488 RepID=UPI003B4FDAE3